jgi:hypothetical protein
MAITKIIPSPFGSGSEESSGRDSAHRRQGAEPRQDRGAQAEAEGESQQETAQRQQREAGAEVAPLLSSGFGVGSPMN